MSTTDDGGRAFPVPMIPCDNTGGYTEVRHEGMTLRDYFAGLAMQGMCHPLEDGGVYPPTHEDEDFAPWPKGDPDDIVYFLTHGGTWKANLRSELPRRKPVQPMQLTVSYERSIARQAYRFADAMLAERAKKGGGQ